MANSKTTKTKKTSAAKKKNPSPKKNSKKQNLSFYESHRSAIMFVYLIVSLLLMTVAFIPGRNVWASIRGFFFGFFGLFSFGFSLFFCLSSFGFISFSLPGIIVNLKNKYRILRVKCSFQSATMCTGKANSKIIKSIIPKKISQPAVNTSPPAQFFY